MNVTMIPNGHQDMFYVIETETWETRYFNTRKYKIYRQLQHYVYPRFPELNFTRRETQVWPVHPQHGFITGSRPLSYRAAGFQPPLERVPF